MENQKVIGTNCYNCLYVSKKEEIADRNELNEQGGIDPSTDGDMKRAQTADLITLPGGSRDEVIGKRFCNNEAIQLYVTVRMCCAYWDNKSVRRPWEKKIAEPEYIDQII